MTDRECWAWISKIEGIYQQKITKLLKIFGGIRNLYQAETSELMLRAGMSKREAENMVSTRKNFVPEEFFYLLEQKKIHFVCQSDTEFPSKLRPFSYSPYYLFYKGRLPDENIPAVAMVGARACTDYGRKTATKISTYLSQRGIQIISGMARGIDTYSQLGAIKGGTPTFAVLGCGADLCYPAENIELYEKICSNGGILSEYPPETKPLAWHFPQRNRIISGLADKIIIVEARENSGSLITAEWALEQGKDIMAVPGKLGDCASMGCNRLIRAGADIVTSPEDILEDFKYVVFKEESESNAGEKTLEKDFFMVYSELSLQSKNIYELLEATGLEYERLVNVLLQLQLQGFVEQTAENCYIRIK